MKPGERLGEQLRKESERLRGLDRYRSLAHELMIHAQNAEAAQRALDFSKENRRG